MASTTKVRKCLICGRRPAASEQGFCHDCQTSLDAEKRRKRQANKADKYITYRGVTVALFKDKDGDTYKPVFTTINPDRLPKSRLINLDRYCVGFTREQVKKFKRLCSSFNK